MRSVTFLPHPYSAKTHLYWTPDPDIFTIKMKKKGLSGNITKINNAKLGGHIMKLKYLKFSLYFLHFGF